MFYTDDGSRLLTTDEIEELLRVAVEHAGGELGSWRLEHVDANPGQSTTATYRARVLWPYGIRNELIGVSARAYGLTSTDSKAEIFADGDRAVAVWLYPKDPDLPGLARAAYREKMAEIVTQYNLVGCPVTPDDLQLAMIGYRPRRRAVLKLTVKNPDASFYVKVLRNRAFRQTLQRHQILVEAGLPAPRVLAATEDNILIMEEMAGRPLAEAIFDTEPPVSAQELVELLDRMPPAVAKLERRPPWADSLSHYSNMVAQAIPAESERLNWITHQIGSGLAGIELGEEPTHGDFHEGQLFISEGQVSGIIDIDTIGPGRRADDFACMLAHLSTVQRMNAEQTARVHRLIREWTPVFDRRVDSVELRLRAAAVIISLATGPYRGQEPGWEAQSIAMINSAEALVRQVI